MNRKIIHIVIVALALFGPVLTFAQQQDTKGTEFWLTFPANSDTTGVVYLNISADDTTTGTWSIPGLGISGNFTVVPDSVSEIPLNNLAQVVVSDGISPYGIKVVTNKEVTIYGVSVTDFTTDAFLGLPEDILGTEYIVLGWKNNYNSSIGWDSQMTIVSTKDNTTVTITPSFSEGIRTAGVPYNVVLQEGEVYQIRASGLNNDVSGTIISADHEIAVFGGHRCGNVPDQSGFCDYIVEQLPPINTWGQEFVALPLATRTGATYRLLASEDSTQVWENGFAVANLNAGELYEVTLNGNVVFKANKPVLVAQYAHGGDWDGADGDPFMMLIPPYEQYLGSYTVATPTSSVINQHFLNIVAPNSATGTVELDDTLIAASEFFPIGSSGFSGVTRKVGVGSHVISSSSAIGIHSYGFGSADSYGYPGGSSLADVASVDSLALSLISTTAPQGQRVCVAQASILDNSGQPLPGVRVDFQVTGANQVNGFAFTDSTTGIATICYLSTNSGYDTIRATSGNLSADGLVVQIIPCNLSISASQVNIVDSIAGSIDLTVSGTVQTPVISWTGPNNFTSSQEDITVNDSGAYKVVVSDPYFDNCKDSLVIQITAISTAPQCPDPDTTLINLTSCDSTQAGMSSATFLGSDGCDSVVITQVNYIPPVIVSLTDIKVCEGDSAMIFGVYQSKAAVYSDTLSATSGCDSVVNIRLVVLLNSLTRDSVYICAGDSALVEGVWRQQPGEYTSTYQAANGCDSAVVTTVLLKSSGCSPDCNGVIGGNAYVDNCGVCVGGNTGMQPCSVGCTSLEVVSFSLIDVKTNQVIKVLGNGDTLDKQLLPQFSIRADLCNDSTQNGIVGSVVFHLNSIYFQNENMAPYAIAGGSKTKYNAWNPTPGAYLVEATPYALKNGNGSKGIAESLQLMIIDGLANVDCNGVPGGTAYLDSCGICVGGNTGVNPCTSSCQSLEVTSFYLVSATNGSLIGKLKNGDIIDRSATGPFSIRAVTCNGAAVGSVLFDLNGTFVQKENLMPYDISGGTVNVPKAWSAPLGNHMLVATPYSSSNGFGTMGISETVNFSVIDPNITRSAGGSINTEYDSQNTQQPNELANQIQPGEDMVNNSASLLVYPNPTRGILIIDVLNPDMVDGEILLMDNTGKVIMEVDEWQLRSHELSRIELNIADLPGGMYIISHRSGNQLIHKRVIKH
jgi:hypothetical protein